MLRIRQSSRRRLCRTIFLTGCLLPLCALCAWGAYRRTPLHLQHCEAALRQSCGLHARVAAVEHPRPGIVRLRDLELADPDTGAVLVTCHAVELRHAALGSSVACVAREITVAQGDLPKLYALVKDLLRPGPDDKAVEIVTALENVTVRAEKETRNLARIDGTIYASAETSDAQFDILPVGDEAAAANNAERIVLHVARTRHEPQATTKVELHTAKHSIPSEWLAAIAGDLPALAGSRFGGSIWAATGDDGRRVTVRGVLADVDLSAVLTNYFGYAAAGRVDLYVDAAHVHDGKLVSADAQLVGGPGEISPILLSAAAATLGCAAPQFDMATPEAIHYERMALALSIDVDGQLAIAGRCEQPGAMLVGESMQPLLIEPKNPPASALALVRMMAGGVGPSIPATREAALLLERLSLPAAVAVPESIPSTALVPPPPGKQQNRLRQ